MTRGFSLTIFGVFLLTVGLVVPAKDEVGSYARMETAKLKNVQGKLRFRSFEPANLESSKTYLRDDFAKRGRRFKETNDLLASKYRSRVRAKYGITREHNADCPTLWLVSDSSLYTSV
ncbi:uncharacterized protein LOC110989949 [Acanthaster planci]|uniref:Uncharacterized protein LOC110989949 n=1 Tax=Acanthaster planci TaxID=133434 RepID=A0A8B7ZZ38_ACAPL|nr:uncharacterized protein LOC110989949 [Acanthaster planci]